MKIIFVDPKIVFDAYLWYRGYDSFDIPRGGKTPQPGLPVIEWAKHIAKHDPVGIRANFVDWFCTQTIPVTPENNRYIADEFISFIENLDPESIEVIEVIADVF